MNILLLLGRGCEGTGNTRITIELEEYIKTTGNNVKTISAIDKPWGRRNMQENDFVDYKFSKEGPLDATKVLGGKCDLCIITSVPAKNFSEDAIENFLITLENLHKDGTRLVYMQVDNKIQSINRNFYGIINKNYIERFYGILDKVIVHHKEADFCTKFIDRKVRPVMDVTFDMDQLQLIATDFLPLHKQFFTDFDKKLDKSCWYIGRSAAWKGWPQFRKFHWDVLKDAGYISVAEGIERSINAKQAIWTYDKENNKYGDLREDNIYNDNGSPQDVLDNPNNYRGKALEIYGPYVRLEALNRMSQAKFGMFFTFTGPQFGGQLEITMLEIVAVGTIPVIRKELYDNANFCGIWLHDYNPEDIGTIIYDESNPKDCLNLMNKLNNDKALYDEYRKRAYKFYKSYFDRSIIMKTLFDMCK